MSNRPPMDELKLDRDVAISKIKSSRNRAIFIHVDRVFEAREDSSKGLNVGSCIRVNASQAVKFLEGMSKETAAMVWVTFHMDDKFIFIG